MPKAQSQPKNWQRIKVGDLLSHYIGGGWGSNSQTIEFSEPAFVIRGTDIPRVSVGDAESLPFRYHKKSNIKSRKLNAGDVVFEVSGGSKDQWVGRSLIIKDGLLKKLGKDVIPASFCKGLTPDDTKINSAYFYYFLQKIYQSDEISQWQTQSTGISNFKFEKFLDECFINLLPKPNQKQIADVLSAYDDLIENNTKRIKILEEMAQAIYKEWFVENSKIKRQKAKSQFKIKKIGDVFDVRYGKNLPTSKINKTGKYPVYGAGGVIGFYGEQNSNGKVTLVTCRGNGSGTVWRTRGQGFVTNNSLLIIPKKQYEHLAFMTIYFMLTSTNVDSAISGSAQPQITIESLNFVDVVLPQESLIRQFQVITESFFELVDSLFIENQKLRQARDLLLPKLVGGEIGVKI